MRRSYPVWFRLGRVREVLETVEMSAETRGKSKASDGAELLCALDCIVDGPGTQLLRVSKKAVPVARRLVAVTADQRHNPAVPLQRKHDGGTAALSWHVKRDHGFPVCRRILRYGEDGGCIGDVDADDGLRGSWAAKRFKKAQGEIAAPGSVDDQVDRRVSALPSPFFRRTAETAPSGEATTSCARQYSR